MPRNEAAVVALDPDGTVLDAGWTVGLDETIEWMDRVSGSGDLLAFVDAPLVVDNATVSLAPLGPPDAPMARIAKII